MRTESYDNILRTDHASFDPVAKEVKAKDYDKIPGYKKLNARILLQVMLLIKDRERSGARFINMLAWSYWNWLPDYFFTAPASSTGKYHPAFYRAASPGGDPVLRLCPFWLIPA